MSTSISPTLLLAVAAISIGSSAVTSLVTTTSYASSSTENATPVQQVASTADFQEFEARLDQLQEQLETDARRAPAVRRAAAQEPLRGDQDEEMSGAEPGYESDSTASSASSEHLSSEDALELLLNADSRAATHDIWVRARQSGTLNELVELFRQRAEQNPNDVEAQVDFADAIRERIRRDVDISTDERAQLGILADATYDRALELNPDHWDARFKKAVSLTFWPSFLGKGPEAIAQFQTLIATQERGPVTPQQEQAYVFLGNLLRQQGNEAAARAAWERGLTRFPLSQQLQGLIGN